MTDELVRWVPAAITILGVAVAWGRSESKLAELTKSLTEHRDESRARDEARAADLSAVAKDVRETRETLARNEERHGALAERVTRLEAVDQRHEVEIRDARHIATAATTTLENVKSVIAALTERVGELENAGRRPGARTRR